MAVAMEIRGSHGDDHEDRMVLWGRSWRLDVLMAVAMEIRGSHGDDHEDWMVLWGRS
jgi:hypothetical protein